MSFVGVTLLFGVIVRLFEIILIKCMGIQAYYKLNKSTSIIGTVIHELSHAFMCIIFGHKIEDIKLYSPNSDDGTLGYVRHSWNKKSLYQRMGNFFIGVAPILIGNIFLLFMFSMFLPETYKDLSQIFQNNLQLTTTFSLEKLVIIIKDYISILISMFTYINSIGFWVCIIILFSMMFHMQLSRADIRGAWDGLLLIGLLAILISTGLTLIDEELIYSIGNFLQQYNILSLSMLVLISLLYIGVIIITLIIRVLKRN